MIRRRSFDAAWAPFKAAPPGVVFVGWRSSNRRFEATSTDGIWELAMDFGMMPPEVNSGRMYCGPGSGSMMEAAAAWDEQAACLNQEAAQWRTVTSKLTTAAVQSAAPYIAWLDDAAAEAAHAAAQAAAAASAHESARAAMVPPEVINTNRAKLVSLATTNCLGQASGMIADTDAEYEKMWADDADAMYAYARASADASALTPFGSPPPATEPVGLTRQNARLLKAIVGSAIGTGSHIVWRTSDGGDPKSVAGIAVIAADILG